MHQVRSPKSLTWVFLIVFWASNLGAQKFSNFKADFSILEKNTLIDSSYLVVGDLTYDLFDDKAVYSVRFPNTVYYEFTDSVRIVYDSLHSELKRDTIGMMNETFVFKKILTNKLSDFDLKAAGFTIKDVTNNDSSVIFEYDPPDHMTFISTVYLQKIENQISGIIFIDEDGVQFNKTFYEEYVYVNNIAVPTKIKSQYIGQEQQVFKELQLRNIQIK